MDKQNCKADVDKAAAELDFASKKYQLKFETSKGDFTVDLWSDVAPGHAANIAALAKIGFYDGLKFHRVIDGFMIQGGCPLGDGRGGPGYTINAEFNDREHVPGVLSMARTSDPNSAGSQFFVCVARAPHLDRQYTAFGKTADDESLAVVLSIGKVATGAADRPKEDVVIKKVEVLETAA
ncbi:Putative bifunctional phosphatase/peptidyl-prolyl cis-trans isomerase [Planctomycetes bacterium Pan216]|uniref:Peptidyl-prolyl cis-trans isomerase n=1 Tax=Kolteria novifilia TaxID=2527975 RepID=A0A518B4Z4_9BACT|nr:Putative bifunctional phosphatase/peptidyl-prolyl cis-trans isomerase [Planctomycetes bacterium Pan216]